MMRRSAASPFTHEFRHSSFYGATARAGLLAEAAPRAGFSDYLELTKPRLSFLSVLTAMVGYLAALPARTAGPCFTFCSARPWRREGWPH